MSSETYKSVFDIIGPVMVGPSSSHTAGAARIGKVMRTIFGYQPDRADIYLYDSFANTYKGHYTDYALVGGLLEMSPADSNLQHSLQLAKAAGITVNFIPKKDHVTHPNTVKMVLCKDDKKMSLTGISLGGGAFKITEIDGFKIDLSLDLPTIIIRHKDVPGVIANVSKVISQSEINISTMTVNRQQKGNDAFMIIEVDNCNDPEIETKLQAVPHVASARYVAKA